MSVLGHFGLHLRILARHVGIVMESSMICIWPPALLRIVSQHKKFLLKERPATANYRKT